MTISREIENAQREYTAAVDRLGLDLATTMLLSVVLAQHEKRGMVEQDAADSVMDRLAEATLFGSINRQDFERKLRTAERRVESLKSTLEDIASMAHSA